MMLKDWSLFIVLKGRGDAFFVHAATYVDIDGSIDWGG